jgi:DNA-binding transcriptional ArsR family regulator
MSPATRKRRSQNLREKAFRFSALGDDTRLALVHRLSRESPLSISELTEGSDVTRQAVTKHLRVLEDAGIVSGVRHGRESLFRIEERSIERARLDLDEISRQWDAALSRLKSHVER